MTDYYQLARQLLRLDRQAVATELRRFHQCAIDAAVERCAEIVRQGREDGTAIEEIEAAVRAVELTGRHIADDRTHLRHAEAVLYVLEDASARLDAVRAAYEAGNGVDYMRDGDTLNVSRHDGKFSGG